MQRIIGIGWLDGEFQLVYFIEIGPAPRQKKLLKDAQTSMLQQLHLKFQTTECLGSFSTGTNGYSSVQQSKSLNLEKTEL